MQVAESAPTPTTSFLSPPILTSPLASLVPHRAHTVRTPCAYARTDRLRRVLARTAWLHSKGAKFEGFETAVIENDITGALLLEQIKQDELVGPALRHCLHSLRSAPIVAPAYLPIPSPMQHTLSGAHTPARARAVERTHTHTHITTHLKPWAVVHFPLWWDTIVMQAIVFEDLGVSSRLQQKSILADIHKFIEEEHAVK